MHILAHIKARGPSRGQERWGCWQGEGVVKPLGAACAARVPSSGGDAPKGRAAASRFYRAVCLSFPSESIQAVVEVAQKHFSTSCCFCFTPRNAGIAINDGISK